MANPWTIRSICSASPGSFKLHERDLRIALINGIWRFNSWKYANKIGSDFSSDRYSPIFSLINPSVVCKMCAISSGVLGTL